MPTFAHKTIHPHTLFETQIKHTHEYLYFNTQTPNCIHMNSHTHTYICTHTHFLHTLTHSPTTKLTHICMLAYTNTHTYSYSHTHTHTHTHTYTHTLTHTHTHIFLLLQFFFVISICFCIWTIHSRQL
jgi:hypothetical protein